MMIFRVICYHRAPLLSQLSPTKRKPNYESNQDLKQELFILLYCVDCRRDTLYSWAQNCTMASPFTFSSNRNERALLLSDGRVFSERGSDDSPTQSTELPSSNQQRGLKVTNHVDPSVRSRRDLLLNPKTNHRNRRLLEQRKNNRFQKELTKTREKVYQKQTSKSKNGDEESGLYDEVEVWLEDHLPKTMGFSALRGAPTNEPSSPATETSRSTSKKSSKGSKSARQLEKELRKVNRLLELEKSQKEALRGRLVNVEDQLSTLQRKKVEEKSQGEKQGEQIKNLQDQLKESNKALEEERSKSKDAYKQLEEARKEVEKIQERMRLLMFHHIPSVSPRFKDIGPVDYGIEEVFGRLGDYELGKIIGEGHYGLVQVAKNHQTEQSYAMKILSKGRAQRFKDLQQMATEVHVLKRYPHPNIIKLEQVIHAADNIYLATELCQMDIHHYHNELGLDEEGSKNVALGILRAIDFLHSHGIAHLDLKPENILIADGANLENIRYTDIRLCDFGLVNMAKKPEESKEVPRKGYACGTPGFFAPEMILKRQFEGRCADMWSLGCIIMELTLGFTQEWLDSYDLIDSDTKGFEKGLQDCLDEIPISKYPLHRSLLGLIHDLLKIDPSLRVDSKKALSHDWIQSACSDEEYREDSNHLRNGPPSPNAYYERVTLLDEQSM